MARKKLPTWATTVTPFSKILALSMFILLPILAFFYGRYYQQEVFHQQQQTIWRNTNPHTSPPVFMHRYPTSSVSQPADGTITCQTTGDCPTNYLCTQAGPIRADGVEHKTCWREGHAIPM